MTYLKILIYALAIFMVTSTLVFADDDDDDDGDIEIQLDEAFLFFELNDTDGDLGLHGKADGDAWKKMSIEGPNGRKILKIKAKSGLRRQGLTELFFESAEPTFDELDPDVFFSRFPEGWYEWEGKTVDNEEIEGEVYLSQIIPAAPEVDKVGGTGVNPGFVLTGADEGDKICWEVADLTSGGGVLIEWETVMQSHYDKWSAVGAEPLPGEEEKIPLGISGALPPLVYYEFVAEFDGTEFKTTALIPPTVTEWTIPAEFIALADGLVDEDGDDVEEVKFEIIVRVETDREFEDEAGNDVVVPTFGNQSAVEDCFVIP